MGQRSSIEGLSEEKLEEYAELTYLTKSDILKLYKIFLKFGDDRLRNDFNYRFSIDDIKENFPQLKYNPFRFRIYSVFSSKKDRHMSFEDMLDLCSVMSENCPSNVKAAWAFRIFDMNDDGEIGKEDIKDILDRLTQGTDRERTIEDECKERVVEMLLKGMDMERNGSIGQTEFEHAVGKMTDFSHAFSFRI